MKWILQVLTLLSGDWLSISVVPRYPEQINWKRYRGGVESFPASSRLRETDGSVTFSNMSKTQIRKKNSRKTLDPLLLFLLFFLFLAIQTSTSERDTEIPWERERDDPLNLRWLKCSKREEERRWKQRSSLEQIRLWRRQTN